MGLFSDIITRPNVFLGVQAMSIKVGNRIRLKPLQGQQVSHRYFIECSRKERGKYPVGTIFELDCVLVQPKNRSAYLRAIHRTGLQQSLDFFDHNLRLQSFTINQSK